MLRVFLLGSFGVIAMGCGGDTFHTATGGSPSDAGAENGGTSDGGRGGAGLGGRTGRGGSMQGGADSGGDVGEGGTSTDGGTASGGANTGGAQGLGGSLAGGSAGKGGSVGQGGALGLGGTSSGGKSSGGTSSGGKSSGGALGLGGTSSGGTSSGGVSTGGLAGSGGTGGLTCTELRTAYTSALAHAKVCSSQGEAVCTTRVSSDLFCGCPTFVNSNNMEALAELDALSKEAAKRQCAVVCPQILCVLVESATCEAQASTGSSMSFACKDSFGLATE